MKTLNLVYPEKSDIKYQVQKFPDGQQNVIIEPDLQGISVKEFWAIPGNKEAFSNTVKQKYTVYNVNNIV